MRQRAVAVYHARRAPDAGDSEPEGRRRQDHRHARPGLGGGRRRTPHAGGRPRSAGLEHLGARASTRTTLGVTVADVLHAKGADVREAIRPSAWSDAIDVLPSSPDLQEHEDGKSKRLRKALADVEQDYEAVLIDCPPSLGNLTRSALTAARHSLIVVEPSALGPARHRRRRRPRRRRVGRAAIPTSSWRAWCSTGCRRCRSRPTGGSPSWRGSSGHEAIWSPAGPPARDLQPGDRRAPPDPLVRSRAAEPIAVFDALWRRVRSLTTAAEPARGDHTGSTSTRRRPSPRSNVERGATLDQALQALAEQLRRASRGSGGRRGRGRGTRPGRSGSPGSRRRSARSGRPG